MLENVNYLAVLIAAVVNMAIGAYWYSPAGFGKEWSKLMGWTSSEKIKEMKRGASKSYAWMFVASLLMMCVLANVIRWAGAVTLMEGAMIGFWMWLGFITTTQVGVILWDQKPVKLYMINTLYSLVALIVTGAILAMWA